VRRRRPAGLTDESFNGEEEEQTLPLALSTLGWILAIAALFLLTLLWLYCLFDVLVRHDESAGAKALWAVALIVLAPFSIVAYLLFGRRRA
jgi:hypothetical protein